MILADKIIALRMERQYLTRRCPVEDYDALYRDHADLEYIINTTPVGMYPKNGASPLDLSLFPHCEGVLDVIYNPARTALVLDAKERGIPACGGLWMLVAQAVKAFEYFTGEIADEGCVKELFEELYSETQNIILIGMPACGKSTVGVLLAKSMLMDFVDTDLIIQIQQKDKPQPLLDRYGTERFRQFEEQALLSVTAKENTVIATGGSAVYCDEGMHNLKKNGRIVYLKLSPEIIKKRIKNITTCGIAMEEGCTIDDLYLERAPLYEKFADFTLECEGLTAEECVTKITEL